MASSAIKTQGTTVTVGGATFTEITDVKSPSGVLNEIDVTSMASLKKEFLAGLEDGGEASFSGLLTGGAIEKTGEVVACSISGDGVAFSFNAFVKSAPCSASTDDVWKYDVTLRVVADDPA